MKQILIFCVLSFISAHSFSQQITYSDPENDDTQSLDFNIIGKVGNNYLVYKHIRNRYAVSVYDNTMKSIQRTDLDFLPDRTINVDFVAYPDFAYIIYQYQKKNVLHCEAAEINGDGKIIKDPFSVDTTHISFFADNKIYSTIHSEDKSKIMVYKIQKKYDQFNFTTLLLNDSLQLIHKSRIVANYAEHKDIFSDFYVDDGGNFVFTRGARANSRDYLQSLYLVTKPANADEFVSDELNLAGNYLDEIKLKIDNENNQYLLNSLYYAKRNGNVEGLYTAVWDKQHDTLVSQTFARFSDSLRMMAKSQGNAKFAFNDYFIRDVILKKDGGFILTAEDQTAQSRGTPWNRYDYLYGNNRFYAPYDGYMIYSPYYYPGYSPYYTYGNPYYYGQPVRFYYQNIAVLDLDKSGNMIWNNVIHKSQFDDNTDRYLSYGKIVTGGKIHFLFNELERHAELINDQSVTPNGQVILNPPLRSLDRSHEFMPRYAKQVSYYQIIVPCTFRNYICFAKIEY
jgi:hypothetical protein